MKWKAGIIIVVLCFILVSNISNASTLTTFKDLYNISMAAKNNDIQITEWNIYYRIMKEELDEKALNQTISSYIKDKSYNWTVDGDEKHHKTMTGVKRNNKDEMQIILAYNKSGDSYTLSMSYRIKSFDSLSIKKINDLVVPEQFKKGSRYLTVSGSRYEGANLKQLSTKILDSLSATYVEGLQERHFISISGLTNKWDNQIQSENGEAFNIQVGLREFEDGSINTTIGTPIITTEY